VASDNHSIPCADNAANIPTMDEVDAAGVYGPCRFNRSKLPESEHHLSLSYFRYLYRISDWRGMKLTESALDTRTLQELIDAGYVSHVRDSDGGARINVHPHLPYNVDCAYALTRVCFPRNSMIRIFADASAAPVFHSGTNSALGSTFATSPRFRTDGPRRYRPAPGTAFDRSTRTPDPRCRRSRAYRFW